MEHVLGSVHTISKVMDDTTVRVFAALSGDTNPVHLDEDYAGGTAFGARIAHGTLIVGMFSRLFGTVYPGTGALYVDQSIKWTKPVYVGETVDAFADLVDVQEKSIGTFLTFDCRAYVDARQVANGKATVLMPREKQEA